MLREKFIRLRSLTSSLGSTNDYKTTSSVDPFNDQPRKPDWLVIFMSAVLLLTLLIIWLIDIPALLQ